MSKNISDIYKGYKIMPSLGEHMFRVAAVASLICDNFSEPIDKENIISACLLHDMGNIIKFNLEMFPDFRQLEGLEYWQKVKDEYIAKYGANEHTATNMIVRELKVSDRVYELINAISFTGAQQNADGEDFGHKIAEYCDDRVDPFGVVSLEKRLLDLRNRYARRYPNTPGKNRDVFDNALRQIEKQIFAKCKIKPEDINDETTRPAIAELRNFMIK